MKRVFQRLMQRIALLVSLSAVIFVLVGGGTLPTASAQAVSALPPALFATLTRYGEAHCLQPPANVNLSTLSDTQLVQYGFPTHNIIQANLQQWTKTLTHARHRTCGSTPTKQVITHPFKASPASVNTQQKAANYTNGIWSGWYAYGSAGTYKAAMLTTTVPTLTATVQGAHASIWAGVGDTGKLVQDGIDSTLDQNGNQVNTSWWEVLPAAEQNLPLSAGLHAGDQIWIYMNSNPNNNGSDEFYIQNQTTNDYNSYYVYGGDYFSDSGLGECIIERPTIGSGPTPLADFGTINVSQCQVYLDGHQYMDPIGDYPSVALDMTNGNDTLDQTSGLSGGQDFQVTWWNAL